MPLGEEVENEPATSKGKTNSKPSGKSRQDYLNAIQSRQGGSIVLIVFLLLVAITILVLSSNETAQISNVSNEIKNLERQLEEQNSKSTNEKEILSPTSTKAKIRYESSRLANLKEIVLLDHNFAPDLVEHGNLISNRWVCNDDDGIVTPGISVNSNPFKKTLEKDDANCNDNTKYFCASRNVFGISNSTKILKIETQLSGQVYCTSRDGYNCKNDPRVASVLFSTWDDESMTQNDILLTNTTIYAAHWKRAPPRKKNKSNSDSIKSYVYPLQIRKSAEQKHRVAIFYERHELGFWMVTFQIDGHDQLTLYRLGRAQQPAFQTFKQGDNFTEDDISLRHISVGFGSASYMQMSYPGNASNIPYFTFACGLPSNKTSIYGNIFDLDYNTKNSTNIFHQGSKFSINSILVAEYQ